jgi:hypothetical protein
MELDTHEYIYSELLFFFPWRNENDLYHNDYNQCFELYNLNLDKINTNKQKLFPHKNNLIKAREFLQKQEQETDIGDNINSNIEQQNADDINQGFDENDQYNHIYPDLLENSEENILPEKSKYKAIDISNQDEMLKSAQKLSKDQRFAFNLVLDFCKSIMRHRKTPHPNIEPPLLIIHGGAGTGKSKLIHDISTWAEHTFTTSNDRQLTQPYIIRLAPTGKAASLIDGITLHSAFNFPFGNDFISLSDQLRDTYRTMLKYLQIVIIDEISMVKADLLYQLNLRLQEIKQNDKIFGGISVLLFGDLMQLKPVLAKWIFEKPYSPS